MRRVGASNGVIEEPAYRGVLDTFAGDLEAAEATPKRILRTKTDLAHHRQDPLLPRPRTEAATSNWRSMMND